MSAARSGRPLALLADIGGTNVRFALLESSGALLLLEVLPTARHPGLEAAIEDLFDRRPELRRLKAAAFDVACPVTGDEVRLTNHPWRFSQRALAKHFGFEPCIVVNDLVAIARGVAEQDATAPTSLKRGTSVPQAPIVVMAPGTGLGVATLLPRSQGVHVQPSEGGHMTVAPDLPELAALVARLRQRQGHVATEDLLSAPGLHRLYVLLAESRGQPAALPDPPAVSRAAREAGDPLAVEAVRLYARLLGGCAADLVMALDARGGVLIAGDLLTRLGRAFDRKALVEGFLDKGRFRDYLAAVPIGRVRAKYPALAGLAAFLRDAGLKARQPVFTTVRKLS